MKKQLLDILAEYIKKNPDVSFYRALHNIGVNTNTKDNCFYDEDEEVLKRVLKKTKSKPKKGLRKLFNL